MKNEIFILNEDNNSEGERERKKNIYINAETSSRIFNNQFEEPIVSLFDNYFCKTPTKEIMLKKFLFTDKFKKRLRLTEDVMMKQ